MVMAMIVRTPVNASDIGDDFGFGSRIERAADLVEDQQLRLEHERPRQGDPLR